MNRRGFLSALIAAGTAAAADPERLLWIPGEKLISIPGLLKLPPVMFRTARAGHWNDPGTWVGGVLPSNGSGFIDHPVTVSEKWYFEQLNRGALSYTGKIERLP